MDSKVKSIKKQISFWENRMSSIENIVNSLYAALIQAIKDEKDREKV